MKTIHESYREKKSFNLSCHDRMIFTGSLPEITYAQGMTGYLNGKGIKIFDYPRIHYYIYFIDEALGFGYIRIPTRRPFRLQVYINGLVATAMHTVKPENICTFLGQKRSPLYQGEAGNSYNVRIDG